MAAAGVEEDPAVQAARILLTLRTRRLQRWPEWVPKEPVAVEGEARWPPERWPKRQRNGNRLRGGWLAAMTPSKLELPAASTSSPTGSGACSSRNERERSPRWRERFTTRVGPVRDEPMAPAPARRPDSPAYHCAPAGSGPSTSAIEEAATAKGSPAPVAVPPKEPMKAPSPETPLDFSSAAAGSGASSSGDDGARPASKRKAPGALGSGGGGGASSGDEWCSSTDKRARVDDAADGENSISEPKSQEAPSDCEKKGVKFEFDLNMPCPEDDDCPPF